MGGGGGVEGGDPKVIHGSFVDHLALVYDHTSNDMSFGSIFCALLSVVVVHKAF